MDGPHVFPLLPLYLAQNLFGILYAILIHWLSVNGWMKGSTAWSVVVGNAGVLGIQWLFIPQDWSPLVTFGSFAFSGLWMFVSYVYRYHQREESHRRRPWPTQAAKVRDQVIMALVSLADEIARKSKDGTVQVQDLPDWVHRLHLLKALLKSV